MPGTLVEEFVIPATFGRSFEVEAGQTLRIHQIDGGQVGDCVFYNARDHKEMFHAGQSWAINVILGTGTAKSFKHFYSKPPRENVMLTVMEDTYPSHWGNMGGRCSTRLYQLRDGLGEHRSCQENLTEALAPHGLAGDDIIDIFNVFMNVELFTDGYFDPAGAPSVEAWEAAFREVERIDPEKVDRYPCVKGSTPGRFADDRTVIVVQLR